tara:strand:+ start:1083 stop:2150 length:1068 start_codon:yes stop_codon:yes gene_type:complete
MQLYYIEDEQAQMPVFAIRGPVGWNLESQVQWNFNNNVVPCIAGAALTDPQETKRLQFFPELTCYWLTGDAALNRPGQMNMGMLNVAPMEPKTALVEAVTKIYQPNVPGFRITGVRIVPGLPAILGQAGPNVTGIGLRAEFPWEGKQMEEEIYALHAIGSATMRGEAGVTTQTTWGLTSVHAFITEAGKMDQSRSMFTYMVRSGTANPAWVQLHQNVKQQLDQQFRQNLIDNRRAREAIMAQSRALAARNEAFRANIMERHRAAMDTTAHKSFIAGIHGGGSSSSGGMSSHEKYIDAIHDRETFHDSSTVTGTSQHGYADHHWSDGWGNYIHTDNPNVDPNIGSSVQWQQLTPVQ